MLAIPRSKGCVGCCERKMKCDLTKPTCMNCAMSGRTCQGYRHVHKALRSTTKRRTPRRKDDFSIKTAPSSGPALVDHFLALFLHNYLPKSHKQITHTHQYGLSWAQYMPGICDKSQVLAQSLAAVSLAIVGRTNRDERLVKQSFEVYGLALKGLQNALGPNVSSSQDTLAAMMALTTYELWQPTFKSGYGWMAHVQGASKIVQARGPVVSQSPLDACLLSNFRTSSIFDALGRRKTYVLSGEGWKSTRGNNPKLSELLLDILVDIPALFEATDSLLESPGSEPEYTLQRVALMQRCALFHKELEQWHEHAEKTVQGAVYWETEEVVTSGELQFGRRLEFSSLPVAQILLIYWVCRAMLYANMDQLVSSSYQHPKANQYSISAISFADLVIRSLPFCIDDKHGMSGVQSATFPIWAAQHAVYHKRSPEKYQYCYNLAREIGGARGIFFLSLISNLSLEDYPPVGREGLTRRMSDQTMFFDKKKIDEFVYREEMGYE